MNIAPAFLKRVSKVVCVCILTTLAITAVQSAFSYFFEYEDIVVYTKFYKYIQNLFLLNLLLGAFIFLAGCDIKRTVISSSIFLMGLFFLVFINRKLNCGELYFNYLEPFNFHFISLLAIVLTFLIIILSKPYVYKRFLIVSAVFIFCISVCTKIAKFDFQNNNESQKILYSKKGYLGLFYQSSVGEFFDRENVALPKKRCDFINSGKKIVFMHIPKTGGWSIISQFKDFYYSYYFLGRLRNDQILNIEKASFIRVHNTRKDLKRFDLQNKSKMIFFRDPKSRIISMYYFLKLCYPSSRLENMDLLGFLRSFGEAPEVWSFDEAPEVDISNLSSYNIYVKYLISKDIKNGDEIRQSDTDEAIEYLKTFDFIGITENFDEDLDRLSDFYYIPRPERRVVMNSFNQHELKYKKAKKKDMVREPITPEIERELDRLTKYDYIIYNAAKKIRDEQARKWKEGKMKRAMGD